MLRSIKALKLTEPNKHTANIFMNAGFERMLQNAGIITVVFTGIATEFGVEVIVFHNLTRIPLCSD